MIVLTLPFPPPSNNLFFNRRGGGRAPTERYASWQNAAGWDLKSQKPGKIAGPYEIELTFERKDKRKRDIGNLEKACSDLLVKHGVIEDDHLAQKITLQWGDVKGCRVVIREAWNFQSIGELAARVVANVKVRP